MDAYTLTMLIGAGLVISMVVGCLLFNSDKDDYDGEY